MSKGNFEKSPSFYDLYERKSHHPAEQLSTHYCPGCGHGNVHKLIAEALDDFNLGDRALFISPVGCSVFGYYYFNLSNVQAAHGRAPAVATGLKRAYPNSIVIAYQGDGDLAGIGGNELLHAANRGEPITIVFINNAIYGMTGGQMAPTTLLGMKTTTTPEGRSSRNEGGPIHVVELLSQLDGPVYLERVALMDVKSIHRARVAVRKAIQIQAEGRGFALVEVLSPCPTSWKLDPVASRRWIAEEMTKVFPLGVVLDRTATRGARMPPPAPLTGLAFRSALDLEPTVGPRSVGAKNAVRTPKGASNSRVRLAGSLAVNSPRIKIAGFGGQGVLFLGHMLADCGMRAGYDVTWLPSYGPEMRGGTAHCHVRLSDHPIGSPLVARPDLLVVLNQPSLDRFQDELRPGGVLFYDSSLIEPPTLRPDIESIGVPATAIADQLGAGKAANMVLFGALVARTGILDPEAVLRDLPELSKSARLLDTNRAAFSRGLEAVEAIPATPAPVLPVA